MKTYYIDIESVAPAYMPSGRYPIKIADDHYVMAINRGHQNLICVAPMRTRGEDLPVVRHDGSRLNPLEWRHGGCPQDGATLWTQSSFGSAPFVATLSGTEWEYREAECVSLDPELDAREAALAVVFGVA